MAITKSDILAEVNNRTARNETTIDLELQSVLYDITVSGDFLKTSSTITFAAGVTVADMPTGFRTLLGIKGLVRKPFDQVQNLLTRLTTTGTPEFYSLLNQDIFIWPSPSAAVTYTAYYTYIDDDVDTILLTDDFKECIIEGVCYKVYEGYAMFEEAMGHKTLYDEQLAKLKSIYDESTP